MTNCVLFSVALRSADANFSAPRRLKTDCGIWSVNLSDPSPEGPKWSVVDGSINVAAQLSVYEMELCVCRDVLVVVCGVRLANENGSVPVPVADQTDQTDQSMAVGGVLLYDLVKECWNRGPVLSSVQSEPTSIVLAADPATNLVFALSLMSAPRPFEQIDMDDYVLNLNHVKFTPPPSHSPSSGDAGESPNATYTGAGAGGGDGWQRIRPIRDSRFAFSRITAHASAAAGNNQLVITGMCVSLFRFFRTRFSLAAQSWHVCDWYRYRYRYTWQVCTIESSLMMRSPNAVFM